MCTGTSTRTSTGVYYELHGYEYEYENVSTHKQVRCISTAPAHKLNFSSIYENIFYWIFVIFSSSNKDSQVAATL